MCFAFPNHFANVCRLASISFLPEDASHVKGKTNTTSPQRKPPVSVPTQTQCRRAYTTMSSVVQPLFWKKLASELMEIWKCSGLL
jgi:hypothetical protein